MISVASHVRRFNLNVTPVADDDKEAEEEETARANPTRGFNLNVAPTSHGYYVGLYVVFHLCFNFMDSKLVILYVNCIYTTF